MDVDARAEPRTLTRAPGAGELNVWYAPTDRFGCAASVRQLALLLLLAPESAGLTSPLSIYTPVKEGAAARARIVRWPANA